MRRFKHTPLPSSSEPFELDGPEAHHLLRVLRSKVGDIIQLFDGHGWSVSCAVAAIDGDRISLAPVGALEKQSTTTRTTLVLAQVKPKAMDVTLRMATELGISDIIIFPSAHSISREPKLERWSRLTVAAAKQCGRDILPNVLWVSSLENAWNALAQETDQCFVAHPRISSPDTPPSFHCGAVFVGPEGGFREDEVGWLRSQGAALLDLGEWVLRADTAAVVAATVLKNTW